jgi:hypothetical protein
MTLFSPELWSALSLIGIASVLTFLGRLAQVVEDGIAGHDVRVLTERVRRETAAMLAQNSADGVIEVEAVEEAPTTPPAEAVAA